MGEALLLLMPPRGLSLERRVIDEDGMALELAARCTLTGYDASYVALAKKEGLPLATGDQRMATTRGEGISIAGPLEREH
ncbi:type II toxin-antitoxin system VapC family toxin [Sinorhizobium prairiense]|uniref:type II toxin-antitoxin system VapC family toxin n=1 Tax=unclassified Sinorhizobium TaxID=2613772 RepID=UPI0023D812DF|nr:MULTISPECIES: type II toxin-antitoxin system VapC family toxin [unclassified Sinorhizobium]WEJ12960.1 type II toxin-antitoxin system VapC family toxin [Sinorhizobium sp. M103]WEJ18044.1 type II toxin-antitoxin system VapC family toxin [Sinorhizobium sp. K101]WEJ40008.1 type II toxin-antitoxin system VapC family toxin [Sinorhizobium sp. C101]